MPLLTTTSQFSLIRLSLTALLLLCYFISATDVNASSVETAHIKINKSPNDDRSYQAITLNNSLDVLLISDPKTDKAAVSMDVAVGSAANPKDRLGLAHFLEHMLFLGTKKYPEAGEYQNFIQSHGGSMNAFTAPLNTNYFFDIKASDLEPAIDRFSQFFIAPLFAAKYTDRERHAVHSEYQAKIRDDSRRIQAATQQATNPNNPLSRFAVGSLKTLSNDDNNSLRSDTLRFYHQQYSANRMKLVILGKESLAELEKLAVTYFSDIENRHLKPFTIEQPLFTKNSLQQELQIKTLKDLRILSLTFPTPASLPYWKSNPLGIISSLVGYEGDGSLLALLKEKGWASALAASSGQELTHENSFNLRISLTPQGMQHIDEIIELFFVFMQDLKTQGLSQAILAEEQQLSKQAFQFMQKQAPIHYVVNLSQRMQDIPLTHLLDYSTQIAMPAAEVWQRFIQAINPNNMLISIQSKAVQTKKEEANYKTAYSLNKIAPERIKSWEQPAPNKALHIRSLNPFIAQNLQLNKAEPQAIDKPEKLPQAKQQVDAWFKFDQDFQRPTTDVFFTLISPVALSGANATVGLSLWADTVVDQLNKPLYDAMLAGHSANIYAHSRGISVKISGYTDKISELVTLVAQGVRHPKTQGRFERLLSDYQRALSNQHQNKPYSQLYRMTYQYLMNTPSLEEKQSAAADYTPADLDKLIDAVFANAHLKVLIHGNLTADKAQHITDNIAAALQPLEQKSSEAEINITRLVKDQPAKQTAVFKHNDSAIIYYLQSADSQLASRAATALLSEMMSSSFYNSLRTEQQLGYIVFASPLSVKKVSGVAFVVQSPSAKPEEIKSSIAEYLADFSAQLPLTPAAEFAAYKDSLIARVTEKEQTLNARSNRYWNEIDQNEFDFASREKFAKAIKQLSIQELENVLAGLMSRSLTSSALGQQKE